MFETKLTIVHQVQNVHQHSHTQPCVLWFLYGRDKAGVLSRLVCFQLLTFRIILIDSVNRKAAVILSEQYVFNPCQANAVHYVYIFNTIALQGPNSLTFRSLSFRLCPRLRLQVRFQNVFFLIRIQNLSQGQSNCEATDLCKVRSHGKYSCTLSSLNMRLNLRLSV